MCDILVILSLILYCYNIYSWIYLYRNVREILLLKKIMIIFIFIDLIYCFNDIIFIGNEYLISLNKILLY